MEQNTPRDNDDDWFTVIMVLVVALSLGVFGGLVAPIRAFFLDWKILVQGDEVLIPLFEDIGFDIWRVLLIVGLAVLIIVGAIATHRARHRRGESR